MTAEVYKTISFMQRKYNWIIPAEKNKSVYKLNTKTIIIKLKIHFKIISNNTLIV